MILSLLLNLYSKQFSRFLLQQKRTCWTEALCLKQKLKFTYLNFKKEGRTTQQHKNNIKNKIVFSSNGFSASPKIMWVNIFKDVVNRFLIISGKSYF